MGGVGGWVGGAERNVRKATATACAQKVRIQHAFIAPARPFSESAISVNRNRLKVWIRASPAAGFFEMNGIETSGRGER